MVKITGQNIILQLNQIICAVLDREDISISYETIASEVDGWDSLSHIRLMVTVEGVFGIKFSTAEVAGLESVGQLTDLIIKKLQ